MVLVDHFPSLSETFVVGEIRALRLEGYPVRVEALNRPERPSRSAQDIDVHYWEDDGVPRKLADVAWLVARHPLRAARDLLERRRWRKEEPVWPLWSLAPCARRLARGGERHIHVHFAAAAALNALRLSGLTGVPYGMIVHAYDIWQRPRNLSLKLLHSAFSAGESQYAADYLRELVGPGDAGRIHMVASGADGERFKRRTPYPGSGTVLAVGRLLEKKGFRYLLEAAARIDAGRLDWLAIVGDGPLRADLERLLVKLGLEDRVELLGAREHDEVHELLEGAAVFAMPSVIAADGDRDSMPNVVYEALAMEVPVVATNEVGLPEVVQPSFGRLVPPRDAGALARALEELLALPAAERAEMGRAGRQWVLEHREARREVRRLGRLIDEVAS